MSKEDHQRIGGTRSKEYLYDEDGKVTKRTYTEVDGYQSISDFSYDEKGRKTKETITYRLDPETIIDTTIINFTYNKESGLIRKYSETYEGEIISTKYTYDVDGNLIKEIYENESNEMDYEQIDYFYNDLGKLIKKIIKDLNTGEEYVFNYTYDEIGNLISVVENFDDGTEAARKSLLYKLVYIPFKLPQFTKEILEIHKEI